MISQHLATVTFSTLDYTPIATLPIKPGSSLTLDDSRAPMVAATLTTPLPTPAVRRAMDPRRQLIRATVQLEQRFSGSLPLGTYSGRYGDRPIAAVSAVYDQPAEVQDVSEDFVAWWNGEPATPGSAPQPRQMTVEAFVLAVDSNHGTDEFSVVLAGGELLMQQDVASGESTYSPGGVPLLEVVDYVITSLGIGLVRTFSGDPGNVDPDASEWKAGVSGWDYLSPLVEAAGMRLWVDVTGTWHLEPKITAEGLSLWSAENTITLVEKTTRSGLWGDAVVVLYEWEDWNGDRRTMRDYAKAVPDPTKPRVFKRSTGYTGPGAAKNLLRYVTARGRDVELSAVSNYLIRPGQTASVELPDGSTLSKIVASVDFRLGDDVMTLVLRDDLAEGETD